MQSDPLIGTLIDNKYKITGIIGEGGMGKVYKGEQIFLEKEVAVKIMDSDSTESNEEAVARFYREARLAAKLNHPNSITIYDFGQTDKGFLYMVMEFLHGRSLDTILAIDDFLGFQRITSYIRQILLALEAAHQIGLIHRDLKPENIFIDRLVGGYEHVTVLDFGIAKNMDKQSHSITRPGMVWGTPEYMSPEQAGGKELDGRTDIYSLGIVFYELLTGKRPFESENPVEIMLAHIHEDPVPPSVAAPERSIPMSLEAIVMWAIAKNKEKRISSASEFRKILESWMAVSSQNTNETDNKCPVCSATIPPGASKCPVCLHNIRFDSPAELSPVESGEQEILDLRQSEIRAHLSSTAKNELDFNEVRFGGTTGFKIDTSETKHKNIYGREKFISTLGEYLNNNKKIIISGHKGIGKHYFIRYFFETQNFTPKPIFLDFKHASNTGITEVFKILLLQLFEILNINPETEISFEFLNDFQNAIVKAILYGTAPPQNTSAVFNSNIKYILTKLLKKAIRKKNHFLVIDCLDSPNSELTQNINIIADLYNSMKRPFIGITSEDADNISSEWSIIKLPPLSSRYMYKMATDILGEEPNDKILDFIFITKGYPFYINQLLDLYLEDELPETLDNQKNIIDYRLSHLPTRMREILQITSLSDHGLNAAEMALLLNDKAENLALPLELLINKGILASDEGIYYFDHPLWQEQVSVLIPKEVRIEFCKAYLRENLMGNIEISPLKTMEYASEITDTSLFLASANSLADNSSLWGFPQTALTYYFNVWSYLNSKNLLTSESFSEYDIMTVIKEITKLLSETDSPSSALAFTEEIYEKTEHPEFKTELKLLMAEYALANYDFDKAEQHLLDYETALHINNIDFSEIFFHILLKLNINKNSPEDVENTISDYLLDVGYTEKNEDFFLEAARFHLSAGNYDEALFWTDMATLCTIPHKKIIPEKDNLYYMIKMSAGNPASALLHLYSMVSGYTEMFDMKGVADTYLKIAQLELQLKHEKSAKYHLLKAKKFAEEVSWETGIKLVEALVKNI